MKNGRKKTTLTTTMLMTSGSKKTTICLIRIGSSQKSRTMTAADSRDPKTVAEVAKEVEKVKVLVKMAANLHVPMAPFPTEKV